MENTFLLTKMTRSMLIAGVLLGITGAAYAQSGAGDAAGGGSAGIAGQAGPASASAAGQAGGEMSGMSKALPGLGQDSPMREGAPGLGSSVEPRTGAAPGVDIPPGKKRASRATPRMEGAESIGGESTGMGGGSSQERGALGNPSVPRY